MITRNQLSIPFDEYLADKYLPSHVCPQYQSFLITVVYLRYRYSFSSNCRNVSWDMHLFLLFILFILKDNEKLKILRNENLQTPMEHGKTSKHRATIVLLHNRTGENGC